MTDNLNIIKEALEAGIAIIDEPGVLLPYHKQKAIEKMCNALALIEKSEVMYCAFEFSYNGLCPDKDSAQDVLDAFGEKELSPIPVLVIPLEQEQSE